MLVRFTRHAVDCPELGSKSLQKYMQGKGCEKRYAAQTLDKDFVSKLKMAMAKLLGKTEPWNDTEKRGNPADSEIVRDYLTCAMVEQRKIGVTVNQARPMLTSVLIKLVCYMRRAEDFTTEGDRVIRRRNIAIYTVAFHTAQRGLDLSHALAAHALQLKEKGLFSICISGRHLGKRHTRSW